MFLQDVQFDVEFDPEPASLSALHCCHVLYILFITELFFYIV